MAATVEPSGALIERLPGRNQGVGNFQEWEGNLGETMHP
jgi:hypothetical protein